MNSECLSFHSIRKSASLAGVLFLAIATLSLDSTAAPSTPDSVTAEIGVSAMRFKYREYDDGGNTLDTEQGGIPGISLRLGQRLAAWEWQGIASYHQGRVDYIGQTNTGDPYNTRTDEMIGDIALRLGRHFGVDHPWVLYGGVGYRRWDRDILPGTVGGLFESYRWPYLWLGTIFTALQLDQTQLMLDVGLLKPLAPKLHVDFEGTYSVSPVVYPESRVGLRMMLTSKTRLDENTFLNVEPYFEYWNLGRSPDVATGGIVVHEPASKTGNIGINIRYGWMF